MYAQTLILNSHYRPHEVIDWKEAVTRMFNGKLQILAQYDEVLAHIDAQTLNTFPKLKSALRYLINTDVVSLEIKVPAVAVLSSANVRRKRDKVRFSKTAICYRDNFTCQYCGKKLPLSLLEKEHVIPKSQGGQSVWDNIVAACKPCNQEKAGMTPEQAGMPLLSVPVKPKSLPVPELYIVKDNAPIEWHPYLVA